ncbi:hypothetical protein SprV_0301047800 [Sparganum proliferum]
MTTWKAYIRFCGPARWLIGKFVRLKKVPITSDNKWFPRSPTVTMVTRKRLPTDCSPNLTSRTHIVPYISIIPSAIQTWTRAVTSAFALFEFLRMSFGISNASRTHQTASPSTSDQHLQ